MDIFGFSADMLPKLSLLFSGYYVTEYPTLPQKPPSGGDIYESARCVNRMASPALSFESTVRSDP